MRTKETSGPMMKTTTAAAAALAAGIALAGCTPTTEQASTETAPATPTVWTGSPAPAHGGGHGQASEEGAEAPEGATLHQYIVDNKIAELPFKADEPGTPNIDFPLPPDWTPAGDRTPDWAYGAIVYDKAKDPADPPYMYAIASKLSGNVDADKVLELAPGQLNELPEFKPVDGPPKRVKFAGYDAISYVGTYVSDGRARAVGQETIVIPGKDGMLWVLQLNGDAPAGQEQVVIDAANVIRDKTTITLPS
jgi:hypothetical protein